MCDLLHLSQVGLIDDQRIGRWKHLLSGSNLDAVVTTNRALKADVARLTSISSTPVVVF